MDQDKKDQEKNKDDQNQHGYREQVNVS
jgi:hypothetical protein